MKFLGKGATGTGQWPRSKARMAELEAGNVKHLQNWKFCGICPVPRTLLRNPKSSGEHRKIQATEQHVGGRGCGFGMVRGRRPGIDGILR